MAAGPLFAQCGSLSIETEQEMSNQQTNRGNLYMLNNKKKNCEKLLRHIWDVSLSSEFLFKKNLIIREDLHTDDSSVR